MKISYNWLKDYVQIKLSPAQLAQKLTMAGLEVTALEEKQGDWIFEIEITSNRPDWLSAIGIAREVAAITGAKLKLPKLSSIKDRASRTKDFEIKIEDKKGCLIYSARLIKNVLVSASPDWLKQRLEAVGIRPVNNIVDITNFCLMESGQPMHAFDFDKIKAGKVVIRRAKGKETIKTIDQQDRNLSSEILVIADSQRPIAVAGVMGGLDTEVTERTKNILLESAYFDPILIRRATRLLGVNSESSYRFERNVDKPNVLWSSDRAVNLIQELAGGNLVSSIIQKVSAQKEALRKISLPCNCAENLLGIKISPQKIKQILTSLQFKLATKRNSLIVSVPSFRQDVKQDVDLVEEIARIYGYDNLPLTIPPIKISSIETGKQALLKNVSRRFFVAAGFSEIISYNLISKDLLSKINLNCSDITEIKNPLSKEQEILNPTIIPGLLNAVKNNLNHNIKDLKLFEFGKNYLSSREISCLGIAMCGEKSEDWLRGAKEKIGFFDLKGVVETFLNKIGIKTAQFLEKDTAIFKNCAEIKIGQEIVGILGEVADNVLSGWDIKQRGIFLAELNLEKLIDFIKLEKKLTPIISFPSVGRDISLVVKEEVPAAQIFTIVRSIAGALLGDLKLKELYKGGQISEGFKGIVLSLEYQARERTLTDSEVNLFHEKICQALQEKLEAKIR